MKNKIKIGLVGCGKIAESHLRALANFQDIYSLSATADIDFEKATALAAQWNAKPYESIQNMLENERLDLVVICTPSGLHPQHARMCADAKVACLSEKPLGCDYSEALQVVNHFEEQKIPLFVSFQNRYNPIIKKVRNWYKENKLGRIYLIQTNIFWQRPQAYYDEAPWRGSRKMDGGAFMNQACHYIDLVQWFGGDVVSIKSEMATLARKIECEDTGAAVIRFVNDTIGVIAVTMLTYPENAEGSLTLIAERATIKIGGKGLNKIEICKGIDETWDQDFNFIGGHAEYYRYLPNFLENPNHIDAVNGREGLKSLKILSEIYEG